MIKYQIYFDKEKTTIVWGKWTGVDFLWKIFPSKKLTKKAHAGIHICKKDSFEKRYLEINLPKAILLWIKVIILRIVKK